MFDHLFIVGAMSWVMALTGIRLGEATALLWEDYDEQEGILIIRRSVSDREFRELTKTRRARIVGVPASLAAKLRAYRADLVRTQHCGVQSGLMFPAETARQKAWPLEREKGFEVVSVGAVPNSSAQLRAVWRRRLLAKSQKESERRASLWRTP